MKSQLLLYISIILTLVTYAACPCHTTASSRKIIKLQDRRIKFIAICSKPPPPPIHMEPIKLWYGNTPAKQLYSGLKTLIRNYRLQKVPQTTEEMEKNVYYCCEIYFPSTKTKSSQTKMNIKIKVKTYKQICNVLHTHSVFTRAVQKVDCVFVCNKKGREWRGYLGVWAFRHSVWHTVEILGGL